MRDLSPTRRADLLVGREQSIRKRGLGRGDQSAQGDQFTRGRDTRTNSNSTITSPAKKIHAASASRAKATEEKTLENAGNLRYIPPSSATKKTPSKSQKSDENNNAAAAADDDDKEMKLPSLIFPLLQTDTNSGALGLEGGKNDDSCRHAEDITARITFGTLGCSPCVSPLGRSSPEALKAAKRREGENREGMFNDLGTKCGDTIDDEGSLAIQQPEVPEGETRYACMPC